MKNYFLALVGAALFLTSCSKEAVVDTTTTPTTETPAALVIDANTLGNLNSALGANLTGAAATQWEVAGVDLYAAQITLDRESTYAYFEAEDGAFLMTKKGSTAFRGGKHCKGDTIAVATLPASVTTYVTDNYAGYTIQRACADTINGVVQYRVKITDLTNKVTLIFDANWVFVKAVTKVKGSGHSGGQSTEVAIALSEVPASATAYVTANYAGYTITKAEKETDKNGVISYELYLTNGTATVKLIFDANWVFVKASTKNGNSGNGNNGNGNHNSVKLPLADVSPLATAYVTANYAGYTIKEAEKETDKNGVVTYELYLTNGTKKVKLIFDAAWNFVKVG